MTKWWPGPIPSRYFIARERAWGHVSPLGGRYSRELIIFFFSSDMESQWAPSSSPKCSSLRSLLQLTLIPENPVQMSSVSLHRDRSELWKEVKSSRFLYSPRQSLLASSRPLTDNLVSVQPTMEPAWLPIDCACRNRQKNTLPRCLSDSLRNCSSALKWLIGCWSPQLQLVGWPGIIALNFINQSSKMEGHNKKEHTPLTKRGSISQVDESLLLESGKSKNRQEIEALLSRFNEINGQVEIEGDITSFNLISYEKENDKIKYDPQMMVAKLRKLQNRAEISRAERQIQNREKKRLKKHSYSSSVREKPEDYQTIYKQYIQNNKSVSEFEEVSDDESNQNRNAHKGLAFVNQLKRHPLLLEYTISKIQSREKVVEDKEKEQKMRTTIYKYTKENHEVREDFKEILEEQAKKDKNQTLLNPEAIVESKFSKFFVRKSAQKLGQDIKSIPRCSKILEKQNHILSQIDERSLSKENKNKLRSRLNEIILSISKTEKAAHLAQFALPKIGAGKDARKLS